MVSTAPLPWNLITAFATSAKDSALPVPQLKIPEMPLKTVAEGVAEYMAWLK